MAQFTPSPEQIEYAKSLQAAPDTEGAAYSSEQIAFAKGLAPTPAQDQYIKSQMQGRMYSPQPYDMKRTSKAMQNALNTGGGLIKKVSNALDTPRSAIVSGIKVAQGQVAPGDFLKSVSEHPSYTDVLPENMSVNVFDYNSVAPQDVLSMAEPVTADPERMKGSDKTVNFRRGAGLALDFVGDPIMWLQAGVLTKSGTMGRDLSRLASVYGKEPVNALILGSPEATELFKKAGVSENFIKAAQKSGAYLKATLPEQAKAGQWAAAKLGPLTTPKAINVPIAKAVEKGYEVAPKVPILNKFINNSGDRQWDKALKEVDRKNRMARNEILDVGLENRKAIDTLGEKGFGGKSSLAWYETEGGSLANNLLESGNPNEAVKLGIAQRTNKLQSEQIRKMQEAGIPISAISEKGYSYAPHIVEEEGILGKLKSLSGNKKGLPTTKTPHTLQREYKWITDPKTGEEAIGSVSKFAKKNKIAPKKLVTRQASVDEINSALKHTLFKSDLAEATTLAGLRNQKAIHGAEQLDFFTKRARQDIEKIGGIENVPKGWVTPELQVPNRYISVNGKTFPINDKLKELQNIPMPAPKARIIESRWKSTIQPDVATKELEKLYSGYISAWKRHTLFLFPEYHTRNAVGDIWNGWMQGWQPHQIPIDIKEAAMSQLGKGGSMKTGLYGTMSGKAVLKKARDYGVIGTGQWGEISNILAPINSKKGRGIIEKIKREAWDLETPVKIGEFLESNRRLALFGRQLKNGSTFEEAAQVVTKALFDYNDLTDFEKKVRKYAVPFYTWFRKNVPAQVENLIRHPGKVAVLPKTKAAIESTFGSDIKEEQRPEWMRREYSISTGKDKAGNENFVTLGSYNPTADLYKFSGSAKDALTNTASLLNPAIKVPLELALNHDFFRGSPVDSLRDKEAQPWERGGVLWGNERTNYLGKDIPKSVQKLSELLPFTRAFATLDRTNPFGMFDSPEEDRKGDKPRPYHNEMSPLNKVVKTMTGLKNYPTDPDWEAYRAGKELKGDYQLKPGLSLANIRAMARKAEREGDKKSGLFYEALLQMLEKRADEYEAMYGGNVYE